MLALGCVGNSGVCGESDTASVSERLRSSLPLVCLGCATRKRKMTDKLVAFFQAQQPVSGQELYSDTIVSSSQNYTVSRTGMSDEKGTFPGNTLGHTASPQHPWTELQLDSGTAIFRCRNLS